MPYQLRERRSTNPNGSVRRQPRPNEAQLSPNGGQPSPNRGQPSPNEGQPSPNGGQPILNKAQLSSNRGQPSPNGGQPSPNGGQPSPSGGQPIPDGGQPSPSGGQPSPSGGQPSPSEGQPSPSRGQPIPDGGQPSPNEGQRSLMRGWLGLGDGADPGRNGGHHGVEPSLSEATSEFNVSESSLLEFDASLNEAEPSPNGIDTWPPSPDLEIPFQEFPDYVRQEIWDQVCHTNRILPLFPPCRARDRLPVCPEPNPAVLGVNRESRTRALHHYRVLHDGEVLRTALQTTALRFPDDELRVEGRSRFTRPKTGPVKVYYNPAVDIVVITEGLEGLFIPYRIRSQWKEELYDRSLGYHLSRITCLGMLWCRSGANCPPESGYPRDFSHPWVRSSSLSERRKTTNSRETEWWMYDFGEFLRSDHRPVPWSIVLLDVLNPDARAARGVGSGIDAVPAGRFFVNSSIVPMPFSRLLGDLHEPLQEARALLGDVDGLPTEERLWARAVFCRVRSSPAGPGN